MDREAASPRLQLVAFDVDGTLLRGLSICELIAAGLDREVDMAAFERFTTQSEIRRARQTMAEWYRPHAREELLRHLADAEIAPGLREGFRLLKREGVRIALASISWSFAVEALAVEWGADYTLGTGLSPDGRIDHIWPDDKAAWLRGIMLELGSTSEEVAAAGDSASDLPMLELVQRGYFVGADAPTLPAHVKHVPMANIESLAADALGLT